MDYDVGCYTANLIIGETIWSTSRIFHEVTHFITIHEDRIVTESHYDNHLTGTHQFIPARIWDYALLDRYQLTMI